MAKLGFSVFGGRPSRRPCPRPCRRRRRRRRHRRCNHCCRRGRWYSATKKRFCIKLNGDVNPSGEAIVEETMLYNIISL